MTVIAVDAMGGDFAPRVPVEGAVMAAREEDCAVVLVGDAPGIEAELARHAYPAARVEIHHARDHIAMDDSPAAVIRGKPESSVRIGFELVREGRACALVSAGQTGATMVAGKMVLEMVPGIDRPAIATPLPQRNGIALLLDSGANVDCKPHYLEQFARMGSLYMRAVYGIAEPRVMLLSNGVEPGKGNELVRQAHELLLRAPLRYEGNIEGRDLFRGKADVIVTDGFAGNLVLKVAEAAGSQIRMFLREGAGGSPLARLGRLLLRRFFLELAQRTDYREIGGSPLLGLRGLGIVCHGSSNARAVRNAIHEAMRCDRVGLVGEMGRIAHPDRLDRMTSA